MRLLWTGSPWTGGPFWTEALRTIWPLMSARPKAPINRTEALSVQEALPVQEAPQDKRSSLDRSSSREALYGQGASLDRKLPGQEALG